LKEAAGFFIGDCRLPIADSRMADWPIAGLAIADCRLPI